MNSNRGWEGLSDMSKQMYQETYFLEGEDYDMWLDRVTTAYCDGTEHKNRVKEYIKNYYWHPSTPISANAGLPDRGLPISCFTNEVKDNKDGIFNNYEENFRLGASGGGIGTDWSQVREIGAKIGNSGKSSGIIPFIKVSDASTLAVSQGGLRRASQAVYLDVSHPEIEEFIDIRRPTGDGNRRSLNIHHGIKLSDKFMEAVENRSTFDLISPKDNSVVKTIDAFDLFKKILITRVETGEPYLFFSDNVNRQLPSNYIDEGWTVTTSNLCSEIMLHTDTDYTGVCCLSSFNLEYFEEYIEDINIMSYDILLFMDNVLSSFIEHTTNKKGFEAARASALNERSIGIGFMGYHSFLQSKNISFESPMAIGITNTIFSNFKEGIDAANLHIGNTKGPCPLSYKHNKDTRFTTTMAIAPTASISGLCNNTSQGIDPRVANVYTHKTKIGSHIIKNKYLEKFLEDKGMNTDEIWKSIKENQGSIQHLDIDSYYKSVFATAQEIDNNYLVTLAGVRQKYIDQGQSVNLFIPSDADVSYVYNIHMRAWKEGLKALYYLRSTTASRAIVGNTIQRQEIKYDECISCQ